MHGSFLKKLLCVLKFKMDESFPVWQDIQKM